MGRLVVFLARVLQDGWAKQVRSIAVDENAAVLVEPDGQAKIVGFGPAYFIEAKNLPEVCRKTVPLRMTGISVHRTPSGAAFNVKTWTGAGDEYTLVAGGGELKTEGSTHGVY
jgi:cyanophycinase-like exopeptidase